MRMHVPLSILAISLTLGTAVAQNVRVVDANGGAAFRDLAAALAAANSGDTILIKPGNYGTAVTDFPDKSITVVADRGGNVIVPSLRILNLGAQHSVALHGLTVRGADQGVVMRDCLGSIWIEACDISNSRLGFLRTGALVVQQCHRVSVHRCKLRGGDTNAILFGGNAGMSANRSTVNVFDSEAIGGGVLGSGFTVSPGAPGVRLDDSFLYAQGCTFTGGQGSPATKTLGNTCLTGGRGGPGILLATGNAECEHVTTRLAGGPGGAPNFNCPRGPVGPAFTVQAGVVRTLSVVGQTLRTNSPVREAQTVTLTAGASPGAVAILGLSLAHDPVRLQAFAAPFLLEPSSLVVVPLGVIPLSGSLTLSTTLPDLGGTTQVRQFFAQVATSSVRGVTGSGGAALTLLDRRF